MPRKTAKKPKEKPGFSVYMGIVERMLKQYDVPPSRMVSENGNKLRLNHKQKRFLAAHSNTGNITQAASIANVSRMNHHVNWMKEEDYRIAFEQSRQEAIDRLELIARMRAIMGSDPLLIFLLKSMNPGKYGDKPSVEIRGNVKHEGTVNHEHSSVVTLDVDRLSPEAQRMLLLEMERMDREKEEAERAKMVIDVKPTPIDGPAINPESTENES